MVRSAFPVPNPGSQTRPDLAISRDGTRIVYGSLSGQLHVHALDQVGFAQLAGVGVAVSPVFSPDGASIAFVDGAQNLLKRVSVLGGTATTVARLPGDTAGITWGPDDTVFFATFSGRGLFRVPARGGEPEQVTTVDEALGEQYHAWPSALPNGKGVLFAACSPTECRLAVVSLETRAVTYLLAGTSPRYSPTGHIVYAADSALRAVGFDQDRLALTTDSPVPVVDGVPVKPGGAADFDEIILVQNWFGELKRLVPME